MSYNFKVKITNGEAEVFDAPHVPDGWFIVSGHVVPDGERGQEYVSVTRHTGPEAYNIGDAISINAMAQIYLDRRHNAEDISND